jgi:hypothetical protein
MNIRSLLASSYIDAAKPNFLLLQRLHTFTILLSGLITSYKILILVVPHNGQVPLP